MMCSGNAPPQAFVCAKSKFNLVLLIDVAFYFKCLQRYPTTVLCGPVSNETHSCMPLLAIRSVANRHCSPWSVVSEGASTWWAYCIAQNDWVFLLIWDEHICERGCLGGFQSQLTTLRASCVDAVSLILLRSISSSSYGGLQEDQQTRGGDEGFRSKCSGVSLGFYI